MYQRDYIMRMLGMLAFYSQAELAFAEGKEDESLLFYQKSLLLLEFVIKESRTFSIEKESKVNYMQNRIEILKTTSSGI